MARAHDTDRTVSLALLEELLTGYPAAAVPGGAELRQAAVAAVALEGESGVELLLIRRAENERDPWSGHMSFPGGRLESSDPSAQAAAVRETREEVGLDLEREGRLIGRLSQLDAIARGSRVGMVIHPFVFAIRARPTLHLNHEVQEALWVPLAYLLARGNRSELTWRRAGIPIPLPCYRYQGRVIWGLTLHMLDELLTIVAARSRRGA